MRSRDLEEIGAQALECRPPLAEARRVIVGKLTEVASAIRQKEHRTVGKPRPHPRPHTIGDDTFQRGLAHALVDAAVFVVDERGGRLQARAAASPLNAGHPANHFLGERAIEVAMRDLGGATAGKPSMRANAGLAAERVDHEPAVVGDGREIGAREIEARLEQRVRGKGGTGFSGA